MADDNSNQSPEGGAPAPEMFTLPSGAQVPRSDLDALREGFIQHEAPKMTKPTDPVAAYYAGMRRSPAPEQPKTASETAELIQLSRALLAVNLAANAPKAPPPVAPMTWQQKLADRDAILARGPNAFTADDKAAQVADHARRLAGEGWKGDLAAEAERRAAAERYQQKLAALGGPNTRLTFDVEKVLK